MNSKNKDYQDLMELVPGIVFELDTNGILTSINKRTSDLLGYAPNELIGYNLLHILKSDEIDKARNAVIRLLSGEKHIKEKFFIKHINGHWKCFVLYADQILNENGIISGIRCVGIDRTDENKFLMMPDTKGKKAFTGNEDLLRSLLEHSSEVIAVIDVKGFIKYQSRSLNYIFGYLPDDLTGYNLLDLIHPEDRENIYLSIEKVVRQNMRFCILNFRIRDKEGEWRNAEAAVSDKLNDPAICGFIINLKDVTDRRRAEDKAVYYAFHDTMTDLPNRDMLFARIDMEIDKAQGFIDKNESGDYIFAIMCVGLDRFKNINDMYGTVIGDELLKKIGLRLRNNFRDDDMVSRFLGDTFIILFSRMKRYEDVADIIQKVNNVFSDTFIVENNVFRITISIGIAMYPFDGITKEQLVKNSESAMYIAKEQGRNTHRLYDMGMNNEMLNRLKIEKDLESAIFHKHFIPYFQPKYDRANKLIGMESLIRWYYKGNVNKMIYPSSFIPVAEKNGMIVDIGNIVLFQSCLQARKWQDMGYPAVILSVNISPVQFKQRHLIQDIRDIIRDTGLDPNLLELEITESGIMENEKYNIMKLNEIHELGVKIAIDDFGTGYSSLSKLKDYSIDSLKIDKSFVENIPWDEKSSKITITIIELAHNLGFKVIAEGVETKEQLDFLYMNNCDEYQGYYFSRPVPADELENKLKSIQDVK